VRVGFLIGAPPPAMEGTDAVVQEVNELRSRFGGEVLHLVPGARPRRFVPRATYGLHGLGALRRLDREVDVLHVYHSQLYLFPVLRLLHKPIVYSVVSGLGRRFPPPESLRRLAAIAVPSPRDQERLVERGAVQARVVPAGVDTAGLDFTPIVPGDTFVLLAGSAPWTRGQFRTKGIDALLEVARRVPSLRLVLLWRGWLLDEVRRRVDSQGLSGRVEIVTEHVDVNQLLRRVHAAVVLAEAPELVKAYPHSLLEAIVCGRPVLVSDRIALADHVRTSNCGRVVQGVDRSDLQRQIHELRESYPRHQESARRVGRRDFSLDGVVEAYGDLYESAMSQARG